jgi:hypothetical protein
MGWSRNIVRSALASDAPQRYVWRPAGSIVDEVEPGSGSCSRWG